MSKKTIMKKTQPENAKDFSWCSKNFKTPQVRNIGNIGNMENMWNREGDNPLKLLRRCFFFCTKTWAKHSDMHKMSKHSTHAFFKCHSSTHQTSLVHTSNVTSPRIKYYSSKCQMSCIHRLRSFKTVFQPLVSLPG